MEYFQPTCLGDGVIGSLTPTTQPDTVTFTATVAGDYILQLSTNGPIGSCIAVSDTVKIKVTTVAIANAGSDQVICNSISATLNATAPVTGNGIWTIVAGAGGAVFTPTSPTSQFVGSLGVSYTLRWNVINGSCTPSTDDVVINFAASPTATSPVNACINTPAPTLTATAVGATGIQWFTDPGLTTQVSSASTYTPLPADLNMAVVGSKTFYVTATYTCGTSPATQVVVNVSNTGACGGGGGLTCAPFAGTTVDKVRPSCALRDDGQLIFTVVGGSGVYTVTLLDTLTSSIPSEQFREALPGSSGVPVIFKDLTASNNYYYKINDGTNVCILPYSLILQTNITATATGFVDATCFGTNTGRAQITINSGGSSPYEYSVDGGATYTTNLVSGDIIDNLPPNGTYNILVRDDVSDACPAEVQVTINNTNPELKATFDVTPATCNGSDGAINNLVGSGGSGSGYVFSFRNGAFGPGPFINLPGGVDTLKIKDAIGCIQDLLVNITFPGQIDFDLDSINADCSNNGNSGTLTLTIKDLGSFEAALSTDQFNVPNDTSFNTYFGPVTYSNLSRDTYYVYVRSTSNKECVNRASKQIGGAYAINFNIEPLSCPLGQLSIVLTNITHDPKVDFEILVFKKFESVEEIIISVSKDADAYPLFYNDLQFLRENGDYEIQIQQLQEIQTNVYCPVQSPKIPFNVRPQLSAAIGTITQSYPDLPEGTIQVKNFNGGLDPYNISIALEGDLPGPEVAVGKNNDLQYEMNLRICIQALMKFRSLTHSGAL